MKQPRLTRERIAEMARWVEQFSNMTVPEDWRQLRDEHAAAFALLERIRDDGYSLEHQRAIDDLLGKKAPTLEEFIAASTTNLLQLRIRSGEPPPYGHHLCYVSRDGTRLARATIEGENLVVTTAQTDALTNIRYTYADAPSAVAFVAKFLKLEGEV